MAKPQPSDWGKLSQGQSYIPWALDIARAVSALGLGENVGMLFWYVIERSWGHVRYRKRDQPGWPDPQPVEILYADLSKKWGMSRQRVYDAKKWLVEARMLLDEPEGLFINKNAHEWVNPRTGATLLDSTKLAYAAGARNRAIDRENDVLSPASGMSGCNVTPLHADDGRNVTTVRPTPPCNVTTLQTDAAIEERAREKAKSLEKAKSAAGDDADRFKGMPPFPDPGLLPVEHGAYTLDPEDFESIYRQLWLGYRKSAVCQGFHQQQRRHTAAAWRAAIAKCAKSGRLPFSIGLIERMAQDFNPDGTSKDSQRGGRGRTEPSDASKIGVFEVAAPPATESPRAKAHREQAERNRAALEARVKASKGA